MSQPIWSLPAEDTQVARALVEAFGAELGGVPDGVWAAPGRVNLIGEHTDYNGGWCLPFALAHRTYVAVRRRDDGRLRIASRQASGQAWEGSVAEVGPQQPGGWGSYVAGVAAVLGEQVGPDALGADVLVDGHVPLGAGLSSSAALSCSVALALHDLVPELAGLDRAALAAACVRAENEVAGAATGGMDQSVSLRAVDEHALLIDCRDFRLTPVAWTLPEHEILVIDTRAHHSLADGQYASRRAACERACSVLGVASLREVDGEDVDEVLARLGDAAETVRRVRHVLTENTRVLDLVAALAEREADEVGRLMSASHASLRDDYEVSCHELDLAVETAEAAGALGARMTGGGFGGSAIALVPRGREEEVATAVAEVFAAEGLEAPHLLTATPSAPARRVS
ncbi:Galactokinase [Serinicoccus hydrothermalis]|uniref:Galactokinase n=1 Tax=Serinicoccus hydrothermalis TaxID=1758689 RepID=A0A1B1N8X1_9MICO|nr:galactokinase [Serinicoccus hydrothermalis]ANS77866.1 Galactokinase [Serinicoccus hydrothermalis]